MPFDKTKNQRKGFCFITFESEQVVNKLLKTPKQTINGKEVIFFVKDFHILLINLLVCVLTIQITKYSHNLNIYFNISCFIQVLRKFRIFCVKNASFSTFSLNSKRFLNLCKSLKKKLIK